MQSNLFELVIIEVYLYYTQSVNTYLDDKFVLLGWHAVFHTSHRNFTIDVTLNVLRIFALIDISLLPVNISSGTGISHSCRQSQNLHANSMELWAISTAGFSNLVARSYGERPRVCCTASLISLVINPDP